MKKQIVIDEFLCMSCKMFKNMKVEIALLCNSVCGHNSRKKLSALLLSLE